MLAWKLPNGQLRQVEEGSTLLEVAKSLAGTFASPVVEGIFNNEAIDLQKPLYEDGEVGFVEVNTEEGMRVYTRTLLFMLLVSTKKLQSSTCWLQYKRSTIRTQVPHRYLQPCCIKT